MSGPADKWSWFAINMMTGDEIGQQLNQLAKQGFTGPTLGPIIARDDTFVYVSGYSQGQGQGQGQQ